MKLSTTFTATTVALAGFANSVSAAASCEKNNHVVSNYWEIKIDAVDNVPARCHMLWQGLRRFAGCTVTSPHGCGSPFGGDDLYLYFTTSLACNSGAVESAFWHATWNKYGAVNC